MNTPHIKRACATALAIPLTFSLFAQSMPIAQAEEGLQYGGDVTTLKVNTSGLDNGAEVKLVDASEKDIETATVDGEELVFQLDKKDKSNSLVAFQVDGEKYIATEGKCSGTDLIDKRNSPDEKILNAMKESESEKTEEQESSSSQEAEESASQESESAEDSSLEGVDENTEGESDAPSETLNPEEEPQTDQPPSEKENTPEEKTEENPEENTEEGGSEKPKAETPEGEITDGSNTSVAKPQSLVITKKNGDLIDIPFVQREDGEVVLLRDATPEEYVATRIAQPMLLEGLLGGGGGAAGADLASKGMEILSEKLADADPEKIEKVKNFIENNGTIVKIVGKGISLAGGALDIALKDPRFKSQYDQVVSVAEPILGSIGVSADEIPSVIVGIGQSLDSGMTGAEIVNSLFGIGGEIGSIDVDLGGAGDGFDLGGAGDLSGEDPKNKDYYADLKKVEYDEGSINQAVADSIAAGLANKPIVLDVYDDSFDMHSINKRDIVDCDFGFEAVDEKDEEATVSDVSASTSVQSEESDEESSDFDINDYFKTIETEESSESDDSTTKQSAPKNNEEIVIDASEDEEEQETEEAEDKSAPAPKSQSSNQTQPVKNAKQQTLVAQPAYAKKVGPSVDTGGSVAPSLLERIATALHLR